MFLNLGMGQIPDTGDQKGRSRQLADKSLWGFHLDQGRRHRYCVLQRRVPKDVVDKVMAARQDIIDGKLHVYAGPMKDRDGKERVQPRRSSVTAICGKWIGTFLA